MFSRFANRKRLRCWKIRDAVDSVLSSEPVSQSYGRVGKNAGQRDVHFSGVLLPSFSSLSPLCYHLGLLPALTNAMSLELLRTRVLVSHPAFKGGSKCWNRVLPPSGSWVAPLWAGISQLRVTQTCLPPALCTHTGGGLRHGSETQTLSKFKEKNKGSKRYRGPPPHEVRL